MSRCARCGHRQQAHYEEALTWGILYGPGCATFTPRDPLWIRLLATFGKHR